jgi:hypothetical protein
MNTLSRRETLLSTLALSALTLSQGRAVAAGDPLPIGWREAVLIVPSLAPWIEILTNVGGWEVLQRDAPEKGLNGLWSLPADATTEQVLMRAAGADGGFIRLVVVNGAPQHRIRPHDQAWEVGGIASLYMRTKDMDATRRAVEERGWNAAGEPVHYTITGPKFGGGNKAYWWAPRSPDGIRLAFYPAPPDQPGAWGRTGSCSIPIKDPEFPGAFMSKVLHLIMGGHVTSVGEDGPNKLGLPWSMQRNSKVDIYGYDVGKTGPGSNFDFLYLPDAQGREFTDTRPPNLGIAALRFVVPDVAAMAAACKAGGLPPVAPIQDITLAPYGRTKAFAINAPEGVWFEFVQGK